MVGGQKTLQFASSVVYELSLGDGSKPGDDSNANHPNAHPRERELDITRGCGSSWLDVHAEKSAILVDPKCVRIVHHQRQHSAAETKNQAQKLQDRTDTHLQAQRDLALSDKAGASSDVGIEVEHDVVGLAFSNCGDYLAIADQSGTLFLYKSDGEVLFAYPVVSIGGADR